MKSMKLTRRERETIKFTRLCENGDMDREHLALHIAGLMPNNLNEAHAVLKLASRIVPTLADSRNRVIDELPGVS